MFPRATVAPNVHDRSAFASQRKLTGHQPPRDSQTRVRFFDSTEGPRYCLPINADHQPVVAVDDPCDCGPSTTRLHGLVNWLDRRCRQWQRGTVSQCTKRVSDWKPWMRLFRLPGSSGNLMNTIPAECSGLSFTRRLSQLATPKDANRSNVSACNSGSERA
jgi:hypothetical protein